LKITTLRTKHKELKEYCKEGLHKGCDGGDYEDYLLVRLDTFSLILGWIISEKNEVWPVKNRFLIMEKK